MLYNPLPADRWKCLNDVLRNAWLHVNAHRGIMVRKLLNSKKVILEVKKELHRKLAQVRQERNEFKTQNDTLLREK